MSAHGRMRSRNAWIQAGPGRRSPATSMRLVNVKAYTPDMADSLAMALYPEEWISGIGVYLL